MRSDGDGYPDRLVPEPLRRPPAARRRHRRLCGRVVVVLVAPSQAALILFRLVQGGAAGIIQPLAQAILLDIYPKRSHGRILAIWGATVMAGPILGPVLGGVITDLASWRWIFVLNLPLGMIAMAGLGEVPASSEPRRRSPVDNIGILLWVPGVGALQLSIERSIGDTWPPSPEVTFETAITALAFSTIAIRCVRSRFSLFRFKVFRDVNYSTSVFYNFMVGALIFTTIVFLPALSEGALGYDATLAGLAISPGGIGTMATMFAVGYLIDKVDHRALLVSGTVITAGAFELISRMPPQDGGMWLAGASILIGVGVGLLSRHSAPLPIRASAPNCGPMRLGCTTCCANSAAPPEWRR